MPDIGKLDDNGQFVPWVEEDRLIDAVVGTMRSALGSLQDNVQRAILLRDNAGNLVRDIKVDIKTDNAVRHEKTIQLVGQLEFSRTGTASLRFDATFSPMALYVDAAASDDLYSKMKTSVA